MDKKKIKLQPGDILSFEITPELFGFAKVLAKPKLGDAIEVYDYFSTNQDDYKKAIISSPLFKQPIILDGYSIFWKRVVDNWNIIGRDENFKFDEADRANVKFKYGVPGLFKLIDLNDVSYTNVSQEEAEKYPDYSPYNNQAILRRVNFLLNKKNGDFR
jgi:hypothetical protein